MLPDPACHQTGWNCKFIEGKWCVGMTGNLDTIHDAVIVVNSHSSDNTEARHIAEWIVAKYNKEALNYY